MARHRPIFNRCRPLTDRDDILDLSPSIADETRLFRSTDRAPRPKMTKQLSPLGLEQIDCDRSSRVTRDNARLRDGLF